MPYQIFTLETKKDWISKFNQLPDSLQDIYFHPAYLEVFELRGEGKATCFIFEQEDKVIIYPYLLNSISGLGYIGDTNYFDITGPYGYNGTISNSDDASFISSFNECFVKYCNEKNIIAEFVRFHPVYHNEKYSTRTKNNINNKNIVVDLLVADLLASYEYSVRKNIKKAIRNGLTVKCFSGDQITEEIINQFHNIYRDTLIRNSADKNSIYDIAFFRSITLICDKNSSIFFTYYENKPISTELVLWGETIGYSYLGGTLSEYFHLRPNEILKFELMKFLKQNGRNFFLIGGGKQPNDGIYNYKANFAKTGVLDFLIGRRIYNEPVYLNLIQQWEARSSQEKIETYKNYFYRYRL
ncbi:MAG: GNAT family N-acetyltransferase [Lentimicrobiaceae bacterium]|jgi:hypothetical protein